MYTEKLFISTYLKVCIYQKLQKYKIVEQEFQVHDKCPEGGVVLNEVSHPAFFGFLSLIKYPFMLEHQKSEI